MVYGEVYIPNVAEGLVLRAGRYIAVPDIEAQLAPNNYMYSHSMTYAYDNYTNTGIIGTLQATKNWILQTGISAGTDTVPWNRRDPGTQPSADGLRPLELGQLLARRLCLRQWHQRPGVTVTTICNGTDLRPTTSLMRNGTSPPNFGASTRTTRRVTASSMAASLASAPLTQGNRSFIPSNPPNKAWCPPGELYCTADEWSALIYLNYKYTDFDNFTFRAEYFSDMKGQRTGVKADYDNFAIGWQHWFSPSIFVRPELASYNTVNGINAFGRDAAGNPHQSSIIIFSVDTVIRF